MATYQIGLSPVGIGPFDASTVVSVYCERDLDYDIVDTTMPRMGVSAAAAAAIDARRTIADGAGEQEILAAQDWIKARAPYGMIEFAPGASITASDSIALDTQRVGMHAAGTIWTCTGFASLKPILTLTNGATINDAFVGPRLVFLPKIVGSAEATRDGNEIGVYINSDTTQRSARPVIHGGSISGCAVGLDLGSQGYMTKIVGTEIFRNGVGLRQRSGVTDYSENVAMVGGTIYQCDTLVQTLAAQVIRLTDMSCDYHYSRMFDIQAGGQIELYGVHSEFSYGSIAGQTNCPWRITGANGQIKYFGGKVYNAAGSNPFWTHLCESDNNSQVFVIDDTIMVGFGRVGNSTSDDSLIRGSNVNGTGSCAQYSIKPRTFGTTKTDLPSVPCIQGVLRNGVDDPYQEIAYRVVKTAGAGTLATATPPDGGSIAARNSTGNYAKITGDGTWAISLPRPDPSRRMAWSIFLNGGAVTGGTITVRERVSTGQMNWNGTTLAASADTRNAYAANTLTFAPRTNSWERVSWKDCYADAQLNARWGDVTVIEITTSGLVGTLYLDDFAFAPM